MDRQAARMRHHGCGHGVHRLETSGKGHRNAMGCAGVLDANLKPERHRCDRGDAEISGRVGADGQQHMLSRAVATDHLGKARAVGVVDIDDSGATRHQKLGEEPGLGGEIGLHVRMVIQMIAAQIGEGRDMDVQPVQTALSQPVAAGFKRQMRDTGGCQGRQRGMQADSVRCCQRRQAHHAALHGARVGALKPESADRGGVPCGARPDLAQEFGGGGLAVGAGHRGDHARLPVPEARCRMRQIAARIIGCHDRYTGLGDGGEGIIKRPVISQYRDGTGLDRLRSEAASVTCAAIDGDKQVARRDLA